MASRSYSALDFSLLQELRSNEITKRNRAYLVNPGGRKPEIRRENNYNLKLEHLEPWKPFCSLRKSNHFVEFDSTMMKPRVLDVHETGQEEVIELLLSRADELRDRGFDMSLLSDLMDFHASRSSSSLVYLNQEPVKPLLDLMMHNPESSINSDAQILFSSSRAELNDNVVSIAAEFHMLKKSARWRKLSRLVPQFQRFDSEVLIDTVQLNEVNLDAVTLVPLKSPEKTRFKPPPKKQNPKIRDREKDLYKRNHLHACESLISLMIGSEQHRQSTLLSLKKSCGDLSELLTQFSIVIAGTGIAVFFSVVSSVASRRVPFCANKVFDSALSLSLVLLSWAVSRLREAIVNVKRKAIKDEETTNTVERRIKDVYFGAATAIAMVALRFG
ncbi:hypothetical protein EUTSA_v10007898mg [Eutrema salsugineum]|uniref:Uncharacterized protein n=1 Tax=Eutrema salsugineum TaxID=72664 RepID=V4L2U9_EUTSA|nr:uncharacterized protein LOC18994526 [Eutrema salsugineum]ESQ36597.1 hypothetical protein EUTSA_v10007898mg [Eutrema salsugineum]